MSLLFMRSIRRGVLTIAGDPGALQSYCYVPDWARAAALLAEKRTALAAFDSHWRPRPSRDHARLLNSRRKRTVGTAPQCRSLAQA
jgi:nucleoside-diphosphate-sugar epimerase